MKNLEKAKELLQMSVMKVQVNNDLFGLNEPTGRANKDDPLFEWDESLFFDGYLIISPEGTAMQEAHDA